jgi:AcrR family transcriptional regulator
LTSPPASSEGTSLHSSDAPRATRQRDPEATRLDILEVATREFAQHGFHGGRVDEIAAKTRTTKRMIYYYFGSKEQLYTAVLERAYAAIRAAERNLVVDESDPVTAIRRLVELTFDYHESHPDFIRLVSIENIARAEHMQGGFAHLGNPALVLIGEILERGYAAGVFRRKVDSLDLHLLISAFSFFRVANRYTIQAVFGHDTLDERRRAHSRRIVGDMVVDYLTCDDADTRYAGVATGRSRSSSETSRNDRKSRSK